MDARKGREEGGEGAEMILYDEEKRIFTIHTDHSTYQMMADHYGYLLHLYYGNRTDGQTDYLLTYRDRGFSGNPGCAGRNRTYSLDALPQEFPFQGGGDFRSTLLCVRDSTGIAGCDLRYREHRIRNGKYGLTGLPAVYAGEKDDAVTLEIVLEDRRLGLEATLLYGVLPHCDIITRSVILRNKGKDGFFFDKAQTACLDFVHGDFDFTVFQGRHAMERIPRRQRLIGGNQVIGSRRGASSHQYNPFVILSEHDAGEHAGRCWSMQLVYSGSFEAEAGRDQYGQTRMQMGMGDGRLDYPLGAGEELTLPEVIMSFSGNGLAGLSQNHHRCIQRHVIRGKYRDCPRPVILNSWEASYFDFTGRTVVELARQAKSLGIDMVVMDDGWFGERRDDLRGLGDWFANEEKLGGTLGDLVKQVNAEGVRFGIWMEPEMVSEDSELYREHPDWTLAIPGAEPVRGRYQLVLDFSRSEVREYIFQRICEVLDQGNIEYLKWDCNRNIVETYSNPGKQVREHRGMSSVSRGKVLHEYILGLYDVLERLHQRFPELLIEGCCGGGGRFDAGMLYYTPQIWCSDNTDAVDRLLIQYGTSFGYPTAAIGAHVSACPNEQTGRTAPLATRGAVAMAGTFGYELDPAKLSEEERQEIRRQMTVYREMRRLVQEGLYFRLSDHLNCDGSAGPRTDEFVAWEFAEESGRQAVVTVVTTGIHGNMPTQYVRLRGLTPGAMYKVEPEEAPESWNGATPRIYPAEALMDMGLPLPEMQDEYQSVIFRLLREDAHREGRKHPL